MCVTWGYALGSNNFYKVYLYFSTVSAIAFLTAYLPLPTLHEVEDFRFERNLFGITFPLSLRQPACLQRWR